jgi:hypothetical protein
VFILGVNAAGLESGNADMTAGRDLPWLQDTLEANVWGAWKATWRDVMVLDGENRLFYTYNLTENDLSIPTHYAELRQILLNAR